MTLETDRPGLGFEQLADGAHGRGLAGAVGAEDGDDLSLVHFQRDALDAAILP